MSNNVENISIDNYTYNLPDDRIAKYPLKERSASKLLIYRGGNISDNVFNSLHTHLPADSLLIFNNTKVIQARMEFRKSTGARIEIFCLEPVEPSDYESIFACKQECTWKCIIGNARKWKSGKLEHQITVDGNTISVFAEKTDNYNTDGTIRFSWVDGIDISFGEILDCIGEIPIPPYLNRDAEENDKSTYQTVYSRHKGSVAAPTAGLHFTDQVFDNLKTDGHKVNYVTLHVGAGTFKPVKSETIGGHDMHTEHFAVSKDTIIDILNSKSIIPVGTTSVRTLETLYWMGVLASEGKLTNYTVLDQWAAYTLNQDISKSDALKAVLDFMEKNTLDKINGATKIIIAPGYKFKIINGLVTNFHQPQSTLLLLISALVGENWRDIYNHALDNNYRFLSYGDSSLLLP